MAAPSSTKLVRLTSVLMVFLLAVLYQVHTTKPFTVLSQGELGDMPEREAGLNSTERTPSVRSRFNRDLMPRILALYFPQYHRDPINDKNWGVNFTDWVSLLASPRLNKEGFEIPRPTELGYYDLSHTEPRKRQGELAKKYGIDGFIYHHYWFYDRAHPGPNLAVPLLNMLDDGHPDIPFFLNWCSVRWINVWMGNAVNQTVPTNCVGRRKQRVRCPPVILQEQYFDPTKEEIETHYQWLSRFFHHENYIRIQNQPVMLLYQYIERALPIVEELRKLAIKNGFDGIYWIVGRSAAPDEIFAMNKEHPSLTVIIKEATQTLDLFLLENVFNQSMTYPHPLAWVSTYEIPKWCKRGRLREEAAPGTRQEVTGILTAFDNTPRRQYNDATIYGADTPSRILDRFRTNLRTALYYSACCQRQTEDQFVAINAWNEWGEGMALEPSDTYGRGFLEIIHDVKEELRNAGCKID
ncbi:hypothetical protein ACHAXA_002817 [Cyclostephanos tholiformis]|uniref:Glycosyl transferase family WbsX n=1 Tax=Cyclostephanos tholiformis TaxID=382380 RepID=A0ABD3RAW6_9STRA